MSKNDYMHWLMILFEGSITLTCQKNRRKIYTLAQRAQSTRWAS